MRSFRYYLSVFAGQTIRLGLGLLGKKATSLPGKVAVFLYPDLLKVINDLCRKKVIITGTNGKTTTNNIIHHVLMGQSTSILSNLEGSNMKQGLASVYLKNMKRSYDWGLFEIDEGSFPSITRYIKPDYVVVTNFFRDQLDRYGEIETSVNRVYDAVRSLSCVLILNADDPFVAKFKLLKKTSLFYSVKKSRLSNQKGSIVETRFCPVCNRSLRYSYFNYGHLGSYQCSCGFRTPHPDYYAGCVKQRAQKYIFDFHAGKRSFRQVSFNYTGLYNVYNCTAAMSLCFELGIDAREIIRRVKTFVYRLGRLEEIVFQNKTVKLVLAKNPIGLTQVMQNISLDERKKSVLFLLNDNIADGRDVSWIWDADFSFLLRMKNLNGVFCSGKRAEDLAVRIKYAGMKTSLIKGIDNNIRSSLKNVLAERSDVVYVVPTYTALFQTRDILLYYQNHQQELHGKD